MKLVASNYNQGEIMKIIREWTELTQAQFARELDVSESTVSKYEQNLRDYSMSTLLKIAQKFDIEITFEKE